jgi:hypothetical protein
MHITDRPVPAKAQEYLLSIAGRPIIVEVVAQAENNDETTVIYIPDRGY